MQFTPQQLAGAQRYMSKTRVGNWLEDMCLEEEKLAEFARCQADGSLIMNDIYAKRQLYGTPASAPRGERFISWRGGAAARVAAAARRRDRALASTRLRGRARGSSADESRRRRGGGERGALGARARTLDGRMRPPRLRTVRGRTAAKPRVPRGESLRRGRIAGRPGPARTDRGTAGARTDRGTAGARTDRGTGLAVERRSRRAASSTRQNQHTQVPLAPRAGATLKFGDCVALAHPATGALLAVDLTESILESAPEQRMVSAAPPAGPAVPAARSVFCLAPSGW